MYYSYSVVRRLRRSSKSSVVHRRRRRSSTFNAHLVAHDLARFVATTTPVTTTTATTAAVDVDIRDEAAVISGFGDLLPGELDEKLGLLGGLEEARVGVSDGQRRPSHVDDFLRANLRQQVQASDVKP